MPALGPLSLLLPVPVPPRQYLKTRVPRRAEHSRVQVVQAQFLSAVHTPTESYPLPHFSTLPIPVSSSCPLPMHLVVRLWLLRMSRHIYTTARLFTPHFRSSFCRMT